MTNWQACNKVQHPAASAFDRNLFPVHHQSVQLLCPSSAVLFTLTIKLYQYLLQLPPSEAAKSQFILFYLLHWISRHLLGPAHKEFLLLVQQLSMQHPSRKLLVEYSMTHIQQPETAQQQWKITVIIPLSFESLWYTSCGSTDLHKDSCMAGPPLARFLYRMSRIWQPRAYNRGSKQGYKELTILIIQIDNFPSFPTKHLF